MLGPVTRTKHPPAVHCHGVVDGNEVGVRGGRVHRGEKLHRGIGGVVGSGVEQGAVHWCVMMVGVIVVRVAVPCPSLLVMVLLVFGVRGF